MHPSPLALVTWAWWIDAQAPFIAVSLHVLLRIKRALGDRNISKVHIPLAELLSGEVTQSAAHAPNSTSVAYAQPPPAA